MATHTSETLALKDGRSASIRSVTGRDAPSFAQFSAAIGDETTHTLNVRGQPGVPAHKIDARWDAAVTRADELLLGVFLGEALVGHLMFHKLRPGHPWCDHVAYFAMMLRQEIWGQGVAQRLLAIQDDFARSQGVTRIEALVRVENERGVRLYQRAGFAIEGTRRQACRIDGRYADEYYIAKLL